MTAVLRSLVQWFAPVAPDRTSLVAHIVVALLASGLVLYVLHRTLGPRGRRRLTMLATFLGGLYFGLEYFLPVSQARLWPTRLANPPENTPANILSPGIEPVNLILSLVVAFTVGLGIYSLCQVHGRNVGRRRPGWHNSAAFFAAMVAMFAFGLWEHYATKAEEAAAAAHERQVERIVKQARPAGTVCADGKPVEGTALVVGGVPAAPVRAVAEAMGGRVEWRAREREARLSVGERELALTIGSDRARVGRGTKGMSMAARLENDRTVAPAGFVADALGLGFRYQAGVVHFLRPAKALPAPSRWAKNGYEVLFNGLYTPLQAATFSLLAFYIASAAYRAFRIRTLEAGLMMAAAFIVMIGQVPVGTWLTNGIPHESVWGFFRLERLGEWTMAWLNTPVQRGIAFGIAIGALAMSLRVWLSLERGTFFSEQS